MDRGAMRRRSATGAAVLAGAVLLALAAPAGAQAAAPTRCAGHRVATLAFAGGAIRVHRHDGYVCAVTVPRRPGTRRTMSVSVQPRGGRPVVDRGRFRYRAGPVTVHAGHRCVRVRGSVAGHSYASGWILC
ncbi:hypothetical protein ACL02U_20770 [Streptomyces sp. MS06]|uniref:hypothetical protein n=1 Tax=Streptomyces sp. MS06 TaxID=3385974 RepID=UPI00399FAF3F